MTNQTLPVINDRPHPIRLRGHGLLRPQEGAVVELNPVVELLLDCGALRRDESAPAKAEPAKPEPQKTRSTAATAAAGADTPTEE